MKYKLRDKKNRNERLYQFRQGHQGWTYKAIGAVFHISGVRAWEIVNKKQREVITT